MEGWTLPGAPLDALGVPRKRCEFSFLKFAILQLSTVFHLHYGITLACMSFAVYILVVSDFESATTLGEISLV